MTRVLRPDDDLEPFVQALEAGESTVLPTDTVYGLACAAGLEAASMPGTDAKARLKAGQPSSAPPSSAIRRTSTAQAAESAPHDRLMAKPRAWILRR